MYKIYLILFLILKTVFTSEEEVEKVEKVEKVESEQKVSDVIDLSEGDFNSSIARYDTILVEFYAPWCSVCKSFESQYESAANQLKKNEPSIPLAKFNCDTDAGKKVCKSKGIGGFPTFKIYKGGEHFSDYKAPRSEDAIIEYMKKICGPASKTYDSLEKLEQTITNTKEVIVLGLFKKESPEDNIQKKFNKVADVLRERANFANVFTDSVSGVYKIKLLKGLKEKPSNVIIIRPQHLRNKFENDYEVYSSGEIRDFIRSNYHGLVGHRTIDNRLDFNRPTVVAFYNVNYANYSKSTNYWRNRVLKVAQNYKDSGITFAISNYKEFGGELKDFGLNASEAIDFAPLVGARDKDNMKFVMKNDFTVETFAKFVENFKNGALEPYVISQEIPLDNDKANVKIAVANNFKELVIDSDKDTLIEFYAPGCRYCNQLEPIYEKLGKKLKNEPGVQIVKLDATKNDVPASFPFQGYPTVFWYPKNKQLQVYEGERELKDFIKFVANHSTQELIGFDRNGKKKKIVKEEL